MNMLKPLMLSVSILVLSLVSALAYADYKSDIIDSCTSYQQGDDSRHVNACKLYIDGFIDSSLFTDTGALKPKASIEKVTSQKSDYLKRVYQTRVLTTSSILPNEEVHQFCIPKEYDRKAVASSLAKSIDISELAAKPLKEVLFNTLIEDFPCHS